MTDQKIVDNNNEEEGSNPQASFWTQGEMQRAQEEIDQLGLVDTVILPTHLMDDPALEDLLADDEAFPDGFDFEVLDYEDVPILLLDTDPERALERQKEMMDTVFGGIGVETKPEKRMGLAMQQFDIEMRHALRLMLIYQDAQELTEHLQRCLADLEYGYGERGDNGRTIAQAMVALTAENTSLGDIVGAWLEMHRDFQQAVLTGSPMNFAGMFEYTDIASFSPALQRVGDTVWRLGFEGEGQHKDFDGDMAQVWSQIADTYVEWVEQDNDAWLSDIKQKATRLPDHFMRAALADRDLRKYQDTIIVNGNEVSLTSTPDGGDWPRTLVMYDQEGGPQLGLSRLSGHAFYELSWDGGLHIRRFEVSSTTRQGIPFEHIEMATRFAEVIAQEFGLQFKPVSPEEIEAAYLRRMKVSGATLQDPIGELPPTIKGDPVAMYVTNDITHYGGHNYGGCNYGGVITSTLLTAEGGDLVYAVPAYDGAESVLLTRNDRRNVIMAVPVKRGRARRGNPIMTTPLEGLDLTKPSYSRALCSWAAWLTWSLLPKEAKKRKKQ